MQENLINEKSTLAQVMAWCHQATRHYLSQCWPRCVTIWCHSATKSIKMYNEVENNTVKCHYNACHYNANASLTRSILGSQTAPTSWHALMTVPEWLSTWAKVWNHRGLIGHSGNDTSLFPYNWNKTNVSHLLVMSILSIHDWSSIKHTDYSSPMLWECHHSANMAARRPDVENNPGSNQVNISHTHVK